MLAAGPIQSYDDFAAQPALPSALRPVEALAAFERIAAGLFKKYVVANLVLQLFLTDYRSAGPYVLLEAQLTYIWLYLDFSAYSDMAVGVGRLLGVATPENFNRPYLARNVIDFWERWHISLSRVYSPEHLLSGPGCAHAVDWRPVSALAGERGIQRIVPLMRALASDRPQVAWPGAPFTPLARSSATSIVLGCRSGLAARD